MLRDSERVGGRGEVRKTSERLVTRRRRLDGPGPAVADRGKGFLGAWAVPNLKLCDASQTVPEGNSNTHAYDGRWTAR